MTRPAKAMTKRSSVIGFSFFLRSAADASSSFRAPGRNRARRAGRSSGARDRWPASSGSPRFPARRHELVLPEPRQMLHRRLAQPTASAAPSPSARPSEAAQITRRLRLASAFSSVSAAPAFVCSSSKFMLANLAVTNIYVKSELGEFFDAQEPDGFSPACASPPALAGENSPSTRPKSPTGKP